MARAKHPRWNLIRISGGSGNPSYWFRSVGKARQQLQRKDEQYPSGHFDAKALAALNDFCYSHEDCVLADEGDDGGLVVLSGWRPATASERLIFEDYYRRVDKEQQDEHESDLERARKLLRDAGEIN